MLYDANFRLDESEPKFKELDFGIVGLIERNEEGLLGNGRKLVPIILRTLEGSEHFSGGTIMSLPSGGDCFYCFTDSENPSYTPGGFLYDKGELFFAENLISLEHDRDAYRQHPTCMEANYATNFSFRQVVESFHQESIPLFRTIEEEGVYYDKKSWPNGTIPKLGILSYEEAFVILGI